MRGKRALLLLTALSLVLTLLGGCGNAAPDTGEKTMVIGDTTFNSENWEETVDPHRTYNGWACIRYGIGETLVRYTDSMELEPWLAKSWSNDGDRTWTIVLQDNVTFSSGRKMDAAAVKQCLEHLLENHDRAPGDTKIADMQAEGQTLTIVTSQPNPALMNYLGDPYGCIIDVDASDFEKGIVAGTGPYVVQELVTDDHLTLTKNTNYWNGSPKLDKLTIRTISDGDTLSAALQAGNIDAAYGMAYEAYPNFENDDYQFSAIQTSRAFFASMNMASPVMQDPAVRKAIAMGIDKQGFVTALLDGHGVVGTGAFPDGFSSFGGELRFELFPRRAVKLQIHTKGTRPSGRVPFIPVGRGPCAPPPLTRNPLAIPAHIMKGEGGSKWPNEFISVPATRRKTNTPGAAPTSTPSARRSPRRRPPPCAAAAWRCSWRNSEPAWPRDAPNPTHSGRMSTIASTPTPSMGRSAAPGCSASPCPEKGTMPARRCLRS